MPFIRVTFVETQIQVGNIYRVTHLLYIYIIYTHASIYICICYIRGVIESATIYILCFGAIFLFWKNFSHRFNKIIGKAPFFSTYNKFCKFYWKYYYCNTISNFFFSNILGVKYIYLFIFFSDPITLMTLYPNLRRVINVQTVNSFIHLATMKKNYLKIYTAQNRYVCAHY